MDDLIYYKYYPDYRRIGEELFDAERGEYVCRQYAGNWCVHLKNPDLGAPVIKIGDTELVFELQKMSIGKHEYYYVDRGDYTRFIKEKTNFRDQMIGSYAGCIELWSHPKTPQQKRLSPPLFIEAGSITNEDFNAILIRLQELAVFRYSPVLARNVLQKMGVAEVGQNVDPDQLLELQATKLDDLIRQVQENWPLVRQAAAKETQLVPRLVDPNRVHGSFASRVAQKATQFPDARRLQILAPQETHATAENRFLALVLADIGTRAKLIADMIGARVKQAKQQQDGESEFPAGDNNSQATPDMVKKFNTLRVSIEKGAASVKAYLDDSFLAATRSFPLLPEHPSDKLTHSASYSPIFWAYHAYHSTVDAMSLPMPQGVLKRLTEASIHPAHTLYELWVLVELYDLLINRFGFQPPAGRENDHPLQHVGIEDNELVWNDISGHEFDLEFTPVNDVNRLIHIRLFYDKDIVARRCVSGNIGGMDGRSCYNEAVCKEGLPCFEKIMRSGHWRGDRGLRPDLRLEVSDSASKKPDKSTRFVIDAKYRTYNGMHDIDFEKKPHEKMFEEKKPYNYDLLVTAKMKYCDALESKAAFIVHSDQNPKYTFWGGEPPERLPYRERMVRSRGAYMPEHSFGAVYAGPLNVVNLEKLLKCFLMYHMGIDNICWACKRVVTERKEDGTYHCATCSKSWTSTRCNSNSEHRILKLEAHTFHSASSDGSGRYKCPECLTSR